VEILAPLAIGRSTSTGETRVVLFCDKGNSINSVDGIPDDCEVLSEYPNLTRQFFVERGKRVVVVPSPGSSEAEVPELYRFGVVLTETGNSLKQNDLKVLDTILTSATYLVANRAALLDDTKRRAIEVLQSILLGTIAARGKVYLSMNVSAVGLPAVLKNLPALGSPTVASLADGGSSVSVVVTKAERNRLIGELAVHGASGFVSMPVDILVL
jgi:ATP phosphoribosyltransferase